MFWLRKSSTELQHNRIRALVSETASQHPLLALRIPVSVCCGSLRINYINQRSAIYDKCQLFARVGNAHLW